MYRHQVARVSQRQLAAQFAPREWSNLTSVRAELDGLVADIELIRGPDPTCRGGQRRWLRCPGVACGALVTVIGVWNGRWGCRRCLRWRSRNRRIGELLAEEHRMSNAAP